MGGKRCCLAFFVLAGAEGLVVRVSSSLPQNHVFSPRLQFAGGVGERRTYCSSVAYLSVEGGKDEDSRIDADPEELLKWFAGVGGLVGSVELEGKGELNHPVIMFIYSF